MQKTKNFAAELGGDASENGNFKVRNSDCRGTNFSRSFHFIFLLSNKLRERHKIIYLLNSYHHNIIRLIEKFYSNLTVHNQIYLLEKFPDANLIDGIFLTHAHIGH